jgi:hypothetical protein
MSQDQDWISTGKAAKILGYSPDWFARKFEGVIPSRRPRGRKGHRRWLASAVQELAGEPERLPAAG